MPPDLRLLCSAVRHCVDETSFLTVTLSTALPTTITCQSGIDPYEQTRSLTCHSCCFMVWDEVPDEVQT